MRPESGSDSEPKGTCKKLDRANCGTRDVDDGLEQTDEKVLTPPAEVSSRWARAPVDHTVDSRSHSADEIVSDIAAYRIPGGKY